ncbi:MAG TPA: hypothetical protein DHV08_09075 [Rhodocyclaceae bacterium]|nr:MAG: hypothetical protein COZ38_00930 [Rhodocyclales bacterium CG_4_10_14_3_um_filter_68_10]HCX33692.1 hypothetical protein [Rhodocyclaceae bacterium]
MRLWYHSRTRHFTEREARMDCHLKIIFPDGASSEFEITAADLAGLDKSAAREWLNNEFQAAGCVPTNPVGKILIADTVLMLAKAQSPKTFRTPSAWGMQFLRNVAVAFGAPVLTIDLANQTLGY